VSGRIDCDVDYIENFENWTAAALPLMSNAGDQDKRITQASRANIRSVKGTSRDNPLEFTLTEKPCALEIICKNCWDKPIV